MSRRLPICLMAAALVLASGIALAQDRWQPPPQGGWRPQDAGTRPTTATPAPATPVASGPPAAMAQQSQPQAVPLAATMPAPQRPQISAPPPPPPAATVAGYRLGTGDKIRVIVYGEEDLSGEFEVDGSGYIRLPLVGQVTAAGRTVREFENDVAAKLSEGYLKSPRVSAEVTNYRPFFILGEVNKPGEYPFVNGMNVVTAVALAGGFTYRADEDDVYIRRGGRPEQEVPADERTPVLPGDIIRVTERFF